MSEAHAVQVEPDGDVVLASEQLVLDAHVGGIADLLLAVLDAEVAEAIDLPGIRIKLYSSRLRHCRLTSSQSTWLLTCTFSLACHCALMRVHASR